MPAARSLSQIRAARLARHHGGLIGLADKTAAAVGHVRVDPARAQIGDICAVIVPTHSTRSRPRVALAIVGRSGAVILGSSFIGEVPARCCACWTYNQCPKQLV